jgi:hypothetical protein
VPSWIFAMAVLAAVIAPQDTARRNSVDKIPTQAVAESKEPERTKILLDQLKSPKVDDRMAALQALVGHDRSLPVLKDAKVREALIDLLRRETVNGREYNLGERTDFQYYQGFLLEAVQRIATDYNTPDAWKILVNSNYGPESPFGQWIAKQPQSYGLFMANIEKSDPNSRNQAVIMLGQVCANVPAMCLKILPLLRERIASEDSDTRQTAMVGLGACGTAEDVARLRDLPACSNDWATRPLCRLMEDKITKRLAQQSKIK